MSALRSRSLMALALPVVAALGLTAHEVAAGGKVAGKVSYLQGDAKRAPGSGDFAPLRKGDKLFEGDRLKTGDGGRLEATLTDGSVLRLASQSEMRLSKVQVGKKKGAKKVKARLVLGRLWAKVTELFGSESEFEVETANAVAGVRGTAFSTSAGESGTTVKVYEGKVLVSNEPTYKIKGHTKENRKQVAGPQEITKDQWESLVAGAMQYISVAANGDITQPEDFKMADAAQDAAEAEWEAWNRERDQLAKAQ